MKHPSSRELFAYWDAQRDGRAAPERNDMEPGPIRSLLGDIFVLSYDPVGGYPFRVAGTRICALLGRDLKGESLADLFAPGDRHDIEDILGIVAEEKLAAVAGVKAACRGGTQVPLELLLLPFNTRAHTPISLTGMLVPFREDARALRDFSLTSWRYMGHPPRRLGPRVLKKLAIARGLMVYEGLI